MCNQIKTRHRGLSARNISGHRSQRYPSKKTSGITADQYVNKIEDASPEEAYVAKHTFGDFKLASELLERVTRRHYQVPTPIQDQAIPLAIAGRDVIGIADTGTGKTAAFLLPLLNKILVDSTQRALIMAPTRELAIQIQDELKQFSQGLPIYSALCIGGSGMGSQIQSLKRRPQFIIGTPGRLKDHLNRRSLYLDRIQNLVLDEADRMVDMGFIQDVRTLIAQLPAQRQSLFFSATITSEVRSLINTFMIEPVSVSVKKRDTSANVDQDVVRFTNTGERMEKLHDILIGDGCQKVLIFGRTKHGVEKLHTSLVERGFRSVSIHGNKNQAQRQRALQDFKNGNAHIMVATDVAARGLDIPNVTHVINFDEPENYADYIHRIGRTGRANNKGIALTFIQSYAREH